jgi:hypothetical protein
MSTMRDVMEQVLKEQYGLGREIGDPFKCQHKTRHSFTKGNKFKTHTLQCCHPAGHDGAHQWTDTDTKRSVVWFREGPPPDIDYSTRFRFSKEG